MVEAVDVSYQGSFIGIGAEHPHVSARNCFQQKLKGVDTDSAELRHGI